MPNSSSDRLQSSLAGKEIVSSLSPSSTMTLNSRHLMKGMQLSLSSTCVSAVCDVMTADDLEFYIK